MLAINVEFSVEVISSLVSLDLKVKFGREEFLERVGR